MSMLRFTHLDQNEVKDIPAQEGNYLFVLKQGCELPQKNMKSIPKYVLFNGYRVAYTGISKDLRKRIISVHLNGTGGKSTLRKSIGVLLGCKLIPRDSVWNGKTTFKEDDEVQITKWLRENFEIYFFQNEKSKQIETELIRLYTPPLNLDETKEIKVNGIYRQELSALRSRKNVVIMDKEKKVEVLTIKTPSAHRGKNLYVEIWENAMSNILGLMDVGGGEFLLLEETFSKVGNRDSYSFRLDVVDGVIPKKSGSAVARDLKVVLDDCVKFKTLAKGKNWVIRMDKDFRVEVKRYV